MTLRALRRVAGDWRAILLGRYARRSYSQEGEDLILSRLFGGRPAGFYVDVGAFHPVRFSNTYLFYRRGWRGINIEPNPDAARRFRLLRRRDVNLQVGVAEAATAATYYCFDEPALNTFDGALAQHRVDRTPYRITGTIVVQMQRLEAILAAHMPPATDIDFLSIDVEGLDLEVLHSNDWDRFRPRCVLVELLDAPLEQILDSEVHGYMKERDYRLFAKSFNTAFFTDRRR